MLRVALGALGAALLVLANRARLARRAEREVAARLPVGGDGIVPGAHAFTLDPRGPHARGAVLLLHGFGDTPQALRGLGEHLASEGWRVRAPLLPGHGRTLRDFAASSAHEWIGCARDELLALRREGPVALCGLSMGGAIATILAAEGHDVSALVLLAPYVAIPDPVRRAASVHAIANLFTPWFASHGERSIVDPVERARAIGYGYATPRHLADLRDVVERMRAAAPRVSVPTLVVQSRGDNRISVAVAEAAFARLGAPEKRFVWTDEGAHVITIDVGRERVWRLASDWLGAHTD